MNTLKRVLKNRFNIESSFVLYVLLLFFFPIQAQVSSNIDNSIIGKVLCGYQGWFNAPGDGSGLGFKHYKNGDEFKPGSCVIDYWPDMSELSSKEKYPTDFVHANGEKAYVFSAANSKTVNTHFKWMHDYNIDGVFVQRFVLNVPREDRYKNLNKVFDNCFKASITNKRLLAVMYDLSGSDAIVENTIQDWKLLVDTYGLNNANKDNLITYENKPVVAIWGVGFKNRKYTLAQISTLIDFFKNDPKYGGCSVLLGVPNYWLTLDRDCIPDKQVHEVIAQADILQPWTPGRYNSLKAADLQVEKIKADMVWCQDKNLLYMPVVFPGFSWHNQKKGKDPLNQIPRLKGEFLWRQFFNVIRAGSKSIYLAMFDEMDEGTCIFKVANDPPVGKSPFLNYEGLPLIIIYG